MIVMIRLLRVFLGLVLLSIPLGQPCLADEVSSISRTLETVQTDFGNFYLDRANLIVLGIGLGGAAIVAHTAIDREIRDKYQENIRSKGTDDAAKIFKVPGTALAAVPVYIGTYGAGLLLRNPTMEEWAQKAFRATVVGAPALLFFREATGADRPTEGDSHWRPFRNSHGASGHAFIGSIPFITAAKMSENPYIKGVFYGLSTLPGLSRINDDRHYFSQAALAWYLAYLSSAAVEKGDDRREGKIHVGIIPVSKGVAFTARKNW